MDRYGCQTASEFLRQHIDDGGMYNPNTKQWRYVKNVTYTTTLNAAKRPDVPSLSGRLIQHFAIFAYLSPRLVRPVCCVCCTLYIVQCAIKLFTIYTHCM